MTSLQVVVYEVASYRIKSCPGCDQRDGEEAILAIAVFVTVFIAVLGSRMRIASASGQSVGYLHIDSAFFSWSSSAVFMRSVSMRIIVGLCGMTVKDIGMLC